MKKKKKKVDVNTFFLRMVFPIMLVYFPVLSMVVSAKPVWQNVTAIIIAGLAIFLAINQIISKLVELSNERK